MTLKIIGLLPFIWGLTTSDKGQGLFKWDAFKTRVREHYNGLFEEFYNRSLIPMCDLTVNSCDINCCFDKDCKIKDLEAFNCTEIPPVEQTSVLDDDLYCYSKQNKYSNPIFCYEHENSPFLGDFLPDVEPITWKKTDIKSTNDRFHFDQMKEADTESIVYKYGSMLIEDGPSGHVIFPANILGKGYCSLVPVKYLVDQNSNCCTNITRQACGTNVLLNLEFYLKRDARKKLLYPRILSGKDNSFAGSYFKINGTRDEFGNKAVVSSNGVCRDVVVNVDLMAYRRGNEIQNFTILVVLADIPLNTVLNQKFRVHFKKSRSSSNATRKLGYSIGDPVRVIRIDEERHNHSEGLADLGYPLHGDQFQLEYGKRCFGTGVQFGYDTAGHCLFAHEESLCEDLRDEITLAVFEELNFQGMDNGAGSTVLHLRADVKEIADNLREINETTELCPVVRGITLRIIYEAVTNRTNRYQILGVNSELKIGNCSMECTTCRLQWSVVFMKFQPRSTTSRRSEYIWSPTGSSYSWFYVFDWGLETFNSRPDLIDKSITFNLILIIISLLIILHKYY